MYIPDSIIRWNESAKLKNNLQAIDATNMMINVITRNNITSGDEILRVVTAVNRASVEYAPYDTYI